MFFKKIYDKKNYAQFVYEINGDDNLALIDDVRKIINQSFLTNSINNSKTFLVIKNLELLNINSKNALLKTIEEPPNNTILIFSNVTVGDKINNIDNQISNVYPFINYFYIF